MKNQNHNWWQSFIIAGLLCIAFSLPAAASYIPFNTNVNMKIGIGTSTPQSALVVTNGNVGIGTWTAAGGNLIVNGGGNVGIGSAWPGVALDVNGGLRTTGNTSNTTLNSTGGNVGIGSANPGQALDINGRARLVGIGTTVPEPACIKADGTIGYYNTGSWQGTCL